MDLSPISSSNGSIMNIYAKKAITETDQAEKIAKMNWELKLKEDSLALAEETLISFYA